MKKLGIGVNFINVITRSFYAHRSQKRKKMLDLTVFFALLGSACVKAACKMLVKLTPDLHDMNKEMSAVIVVFVVVDVVRNFLTRTFATSFSSALAFIFPASDFVFQAAPNRRRNLLTKKVDEF